MQLIYKKLCKNVTQKEYVRATHKTRKI